MCMKINLRDLLSMSNEKMYPIDEENIIIEDNVYIRRIKNVAGDITFYYDALDELRINYQLSGTMVCPCAITLEDVEVDFDIAQDEKVVQELDEDGFYFKESVEAKDLAAQIVLPEAPIKVVKNEKIEYSRGDGWSFVSEKDYEDSKKNEIDPRLQKLMEYKFEEDN